MKKLLALLLALLLLVGGSAFAEETGLTKDIVVLFTSDVHCGIDQGFGYAGLAATKEGSEYAQWFNERGVSAFVLYYRMPNGHHTIPLTDAQTAIEIVRKNARKWHLDKHKIGISGFSAGGHLASTAGTHFTKKNRPDLLQ